METGKKSYSKSAALLERAKQVMAGGVSSEFRKYAHPHALFFDHGLGTKVYDVDGNEYLDYSLSQGPLILGHSHPAVTEAVESYSKAGQLFAAQHIQELELAERICEIIPSAEKIRFCLDGSEAVQTALRVARAKTGKNRFLRFEGHYHGWMDNVAYGFSAPGLEELGDREHPNAFAWSQGLSANSKDDFYILPWNDLTLVALFLKEHADEVAAIITEPVMCNNGCIEPVANFLEGLRDLCTTYNIALIFDEVITGFRLGLAGAQGYYGVVPDLSIFAKAIGSGHPISAIVGKNEWMQVIEQSKVIHAGTMNACNSTVAAALATVDVLQQDEQTYTRMFALGKRLMQGIAEQASQRNIEIRVEGPGSVFSTSFSPIERNRDFRDTLRADKKKLSTFVVGLQENGIRILSRGLWYISAVHTIEEIDETIDIVGRVFDECF